MIGGLCLLVLGSCSLSRPHMTNIPLLAFVCFFEGYGHGGMDAGRLPPGRGGGGIQAHISYIQYRYCRGKDPPFLS